MTPGDTLDGLALTTITLPAAPMSVAARSRERCDSGDPSYPTTTVLEVGPTTGERGVGRSTSQFQVAGGSLAGNDHSLISSTLGRVEARRSSAAGSIALARSGGSLRCVSRMFVSLILVRPSRNGVAPDAMFVVTLIELAGRIDLEPLLVLVAHE
jgi:hypothetical protein